MPSPLHRAIQLAVAAHANQDDPPGEPYILHPMRVMLSLEHEARERGESEALLAVAILHDAVERGRLTRARLHRENFPRSIVRAIEFLTHDKSKHSYAQYIVRLKRDKLARAVKLADLLDNADLRNVDFRSEKPKKGSKRVIRYALSYKFLTDQMSSRDYRRLMQSADNS